MTEERSDIQRLVDDIEYWDWGCLLKFEHFYRELKRVATKMGLDTTGIKESRDLVIKRWKEVHKGEFQHEKSKKTPDQLFEETVGELMLPIV